MQIKLFKQLTSSEATKNHPNLSNKIKILWHEDYYDGPVSGYVTLNGNEGYYVSCMATEWPAEHCDRRLYLVFRLDTAQTSHVKQEHSLFQEFVGTHTDYDSNGRRTGSVKPEENWSKFYDRVRPDIHPLTDSQIVGWTTTLFKNEW